MSATITMDGTVLVSAVKSLTPLAADPRDALPVLTCLRIATSGRDVVTFEATDRYKLGEITYRLSDVAANTLETVDSGFDVLLPAKALLAAVKTWKPEAGNATGFLVRLTDNGATVTAESLSYGRVVASAVVEKVTGQFPDTARLWPKPLDNPEGTYPGVQAFDARFMEDIGRSATTIANGGKRYRVPVRWFYAADPTRPVVISVDGDDERVLPRGVTWRVLLMPIRMPGRGN